MHTYTYPYIYIYIYTHTLVGWCRRRLAVAPVRETRFNPNSCSIDFTPNCVYLDLLSLTTADAPRLIHHDSTCYKN